MALNTVKMFFTRFGGRDLPIAYNWFKNFGFDSTYDKKTEQYIDYSGDPIYSHSLMDVLNNFDTPISFTVDDILAGYKSTSDLAIVETADNDEAKTIVIKSKFWQKVLLLLELIYENQSDWRGYAESSSTDGTPYSCRGDEVLRGTDSLYDEVRGIYKAGSLTVNVSASSKLNTRILSCSLIVVPTSDDKSENSGSGSTLANSITLEVYFNPDTFITSGTSANYKVYSYEDADSMTDTDIDDVNMKVYVDGVATTEFDARIVKKLHEINKTGKYKRVIRFCPTGGKDGTTFFINNATYKVNDGKAGIFNEEGEEITAENMDQYGYNKPFYIFTSLDETQELNNETMIKYVREYVTNELYPGDSRILERNLRYPNLFSESTVSIYPILTNKTSDSYKAPIDGSTIQSFLRTVGITNNLYELFGIGRSTYGGGSKEYSKLTLLAVENDDVSASSSTPISSRFPTFRPIYSSSDDNQDVADNAIVFHDLCILALSILIGDATVASVTIDDNKTISISHGNQVSQYDFINAGLNLKEIQAGLDTQSGQEVRHCVQFTYRNVTYKFYEVAN